MYVYDIVTVGTFEGGDFNGIEKGCVLIGCGEARTNEAGVRQVAYWFEAEGWEVRIAYIGDILCAYRSDGSADCRETNNRLPSLHRTCNR